MARAWLLGVLLGCVACGEIDPSALRDTAEGGANGTDGGASGADGDAGGADGEAGGADGEAGGADGGASGAGGGASGAGGAPAEIPVDPGANVFNRDVLHDVSITVAASDLSHLDEMTDTRVRATIVFDGVTLEQVGVRNKGSSSFQPTTGKPSFSVKLDEYIGRQRLDGLKKISLNNTVQDRTWSSELLTYDTYRKARQPAPRVAHAVVSLNGEPKGIYTISEPINAQFLARHYGADLDQGNLYEGPWDFTRPVAEADLKDEEEEMRTREDLQALTDVVLSPPDAEFPERLAQVLDVDQFILGYALDVVTVVWDGYAYDAWNFYLYDHPGDHRFVFLVAGANWPYFGEHAEAAATVDPLQLPQLWQTNDPVGFLADERVRVIPALRARFEQAVADVTRNAFDVPALHGELDRLRTVLHSTTRRDDATLGDLRTFDDNIGLAYDFVRERKAYLSNRLE
jgi:spore coat protein H